MTLDQSTVLQYLNELAQDVRPIEAGANVAALVALGSGSREW